MVDVAGLCCAVGFPRKVFHTQLTRNPHELVAALPGIFALGGIVATLERSAVIKNVYAELFFRVIDLFGC